MSTITYDVFISCKSEDYEAAHKVYEYLSANGLKVFLVDKSLDGEKESLYGYVIDEVLDSAKHMIVYASNARYMRKETSPYVYYEWQTFSEELKTGRKNGNLMTIIADTIAIADLPIALRNRQSFKISDYKAVLPYVMSHKPRTTAAPAPIPSKAMSVGRNDPCPCGSGRRYKNCHGRGL